MSRNPAYDTPYTALDGAPNHIQALDAYPWLDGLGEYFDEFYTERGRIAPRQFVTRGAGGRGTPAPAGTWQPGGATPPSPPDEVRPPVAQLASPVVSGAAGVNGRSA